MSSERRSRVVMRRMQREVLALLDQRDAGGHEAEEDEVDDHARRAEDEAGRHLTGGRAGLDDLDASPPGGRAPGRRSGGPAPRARRLCPGALGRARRPMAWAAARAACSAVTCFAGERLAPRSSRRAHRSSRTSRRWSAWPACPPPRALENPSGITSAAATLLSATFCSALRLLDPMDHDHVRLLRAARRAASPRRRRLRSTPPGVSDRCRRRTAGRRTP